MKSRLKSWSGWSEGNKGGATAEQVDLIKYICLSIILSISAVICIRASLKKCPHER
jgi:hypothetical protein